MCAIFTWNWFSENRTMGIRCWEPVYQIERWVLVFYSSNTSAQFNDLFSQQRTKPHLLLFLSVPGSCVEQNSTFSGRHRKDRMNGHFMIHFNRESKDGFSFRYCLRIGIISLLNQYSTQFVCWQTLITHDTKVISRRIYLFNRFLTFRHLLAHPIVSGGIGCLTPLSSSFDSCTYALDSTTYNYLCQCLSLFPFSWSEIHASFLPFVSRWCWYGRSEVSRSALSIHIDECCICGSQWFC